MNTRPVVLVCLLIVLIITSQFEWKQQIEDAADADPVTARRRQQVLAKEDAVKEKILGKLWRGQILGGSPKGLARERKKHIFLMEAALWRHRVCAQHTQPPKHYGVRSTRAMGCSHITYIHGFSCKV
ncbi:uncharacterized protein [Triticum aestivum]|uniref:uncharacterized protein isoform X2 n=1 Tax=Triticum aestivum TaxID=4565 RepID=UPI001D02E60C|nr:uncharacterized protein LOC123044915 isoform X2 [Triticum aestivum]